MKHCVHGNEPAICKPCVDFYFATRKTSVFEKMFMPDRTEVEDIKPGDQSDSPQEETTKP